MYEFIKTHKGLCVCIALIVIALLCWYVFRVSDNGGTVERIRDSVSRVEREQSKARDSIERIGEGLDGLTGTIGDSESRITRSEEVIERINADNQSAQSRLGECQAIVRDSERRVEYGLRICEAVRQSAKESGT